MGDEKKNQVIAVRGLKPEEEITVLAVVAHWKRSEKEQTARQMERAVGVVGGMKMSGVLGER